MEYNSKLEKAAHRRRLSTVDNFLDDVQRNEDYVAAYKVAVATVCTPEQQEMIEGIILSAEM